MIWEYHFMLLMLDRLPSQHLTANIVTIVKAASASANLPIHVLHRHILILQGLTTQSAHDSKSVV